MPRQCSLYRRAVCQTVSKAFDRSKNMAFAHRWLSRALANVFTMSNNWVVQDELAQNPNCSGIINLFSTRYCMTWSCIKHSNTLDVHERSVIGRLFFI